MVRRTMVIYNFIYVCVNLIISSYSTKLGLKCQRDRCQQPAYCSYPNNMDLTIISIISDILLFTRHTGKGLNLNLNYFQSVTIQLSVSENLVEHQFWQFYITFTCHQITSSSQQLPLNYIGISLFISATQKIRNSTMLSVSFYYFYISLLPTLPL